MWPPSMTQFDLPHCKWLDPDSMLKLELYHPMLQACEIALKKRRHDIWSHCKKHLPFTVQARVSDDGQHRLAFAGLNERVVNVSLHAAEKENYSSSSSKKPFEAH